MHRTFPGPCRVLAILSVAAVLVVGARPDASAAVAKRGPPLSPEEVLDKRIEGEATVQFSVAEVTTINIDSVFVADVSHAQHIKPKMAPRKDDLTFKVIVSRDVATRLLRLGIEDPAAHFRGKILKISGKVERAPLPTGNIYKITVFSLDQLESIRKP